MKKLEEIPQEEWDTCIMCALTACSPSEWNAPETATLLTAIKVPHVVQEKLKELGTRWGVNQGELEHIVFSNLVIGGVGVKALEFHENQARQGKIYFSNEIPESHVREICINKVKEYCKYFCRIGRKITVCFKDTPVEETININIKKEGHCKGIKHYGETNCQNEEASGET